MDAENWPYRKRLFISIDKPFLDYMAELMNADDGNWIAGDGAWIGIDDKSESNNTWITR